MTTNAFVPLARKWRPRTFADVVGQAEIVRALTNALTQDRMAHAYLFSGPRGVGKTTSARLLAAGINCRAASGPTPSPCGSCESCQEVLEGRSIDALEIDGATHGKVDQARDLIEIVGYAPVRDRRKVFIIDEVHAISAAAFQALLKTLEEPPAHAVFILATTERHKIPATILSRCQRFDFRRLTDTEVADRLSEIASREGYSVDADEKPAPWVEPAALAALAAAATGSLRDGLSLLDQAVAQTGGRVTAGDVALLLGSPDRTALVALLTSVLAADRAAVLRGASELDAAGSDPRATAHDLTLLVRGTVRFAADPSAPAIAGISEDGSAALRELARATPYSTLLRVLTFLTEAEGMLRRSDVPALALEVLLLRLAELPRLVPIEEILSSGAAFPSAGPVAAPAASPAFAPRPAAAEEPVRRAPTPAAKAPAAPEAPRFVGLTPLEVAEPEPEAPVDAATAFREAVEKRHGNLGAALEDVSVVVEGRVVRLVLDPPSPPLAKRLGEPAMKKVLDEAAVAVLGAKAAVVVESAEPAGGDLNAAAAAADPATLERENLRKRAAADERVKKILDMFDGEIAEVKPDERKA
ncbi:MAG: DNA polymerase III subunit gamma/tau [Thermoanaerobaculia bacterium]|jgi:DNA polymerase-3 subunit gamma/tau|nr:DNA polymerase III subunit gamma/tau [Thermoanaerobaculia bacterium]